MKLISAIRFTEYFYTHADTSGILRDSILSKISWQVNVQTTHNQTIFDLICRDFHKLRSMHYKSYFSYPEN